MKLSHTLICAAVAAFTVGCTDADKTAAEALLQQAREQSEAGQYILAEQLLDSIDRAYPKQVDVRRDAMHLRPIVIEASAMAQLSQVDSLIAVNTISAEAMRDRLVLVSSPLEPYYVSASEVKGDVTHTPGLHARMAQDGVFSLLSVVKQEPGHTWVRLSDGTDEAVSATVPYDGELNDRTSGMERITFLSAQVDTLGAFVLNHPGQQLTLTYGGGKEQTVKADPAQMQALAEVYAASCLYNTLRHLELTKQHLEQKLMIARSQQARTFREENE